MIKLSDVIGSQEASELLGITTQHVKRLVVSGELHPKKITAGYIFDKADVLALKKKRRRK